MAKTKALEDYQAAGRQLDERLRLRCYPVALKLIRDAKNYPDKAIQY